MANRFGGGDIIFKVPNSRVNAFLATLQFPLSDFAQTPWERALAQWVAWHDQNAVGRASVGFLLEEIPWEPSHFPRQRDFILRATTAAIQGYRWNEMSRIPRQVEGHLGDYHEALELFLPTGAPEATAGYPWPAEHHQELRCAMHRVHCTSLGYCRVCADA